MSPVCPKGPDVIGDTCRLPHHHRGWCAAWLADPTGEAEAVLGGDVSNGPFPAAAVTACIEGPKFEWSATISTFTRAHGPAETLEAAKDAAEQWLRDQHVA